MKSDDLQEEYNKRISRRSKAQQKNKVVFTLKPKQDGRTWLLSKGKTK